MTQLTKRRNNTSLLTQRRGHDDIAMPCEHVAVQTLS